MNAPAAKPAPRPAQPPCHPPQPPRQPPPRHCTVCEVEVIASRRAREALNGAASARLPRLETLVAISAAIAVLMRRFIFNLLIGRVEGVARPRSNYGVLGEFIPACTKRFFDFSQFSRFRGDVLS